MVGPQKTVDGEVSVDVLASLDIGCGKHPRAKEGHVTFGCEHPCMMPFYLAKQEPDRDGDIIPGRLPGGGVVAFADLVIMDKLPFGSEMFNHVFAYDVLEHLPKVAYIPVPNAVSCSVERRNVHVHLFNEVFRVLRPGGLFDVQVPSTSGQAVHGDPTHCSVWVDNSFNYFCAAGPENFEWEQMKDYGYKAKFQLVSRNIVHGSHIHAIMRAVK